MSKTPPRLPWPGLTEFSLQDVAEVDGQFDEHRILLGFKLENGVIVYLTVIHGLAGFKVHCDYAGGLRT